MSKNIPEEIYRLFTDHADAGRAQAMQAYMKDRFEYFGINSPTRKALSREYFKLAGYPGVNELDEVVTELWSYDHREMQYVGVDLIRRYIRKLPEDFIDTIEALILRKSWWDTVDHLSIDAGSLFQRYPHLLPARTDDWINHESMWLRRAAVIHQLMYREATDWDRLQDYILRVAHENEFFIRKACGWALRQYSKTRPDRVGDFISRHRNMLSGLTIREGSKYI